MLLISVEAEDVVVEKRAQVRGFLRDEALGVGGFGIGTVANRRSIDFLL